MPDLPQDEADDLLAMPKVAAEPHTVYVFPSPGDALVVPLVSTDGREDFVLDVGHKRAVLHKVTFQNRARQSVVLARLDLNGPTHTNPPALGGAVLPCPHLHIYREGYGVKFAVPLNPDIFANPNSLPQTLSDFQAFCNVAQRPAFQMGLFL